MPLVLTYTRKVRQALQAPANVGIDVLMLATVGGLIAALASMCHHVAMPRGSVAVIDLRFRALPLYAFYSLSRGFAAYLLSLVFTLIYGTIAAHNRTAEKFLVPLLDVLQSLPVLTLLPVLVFSMVSLFPSTWLGLELACVLMIFTAQAWNMTFSYYASVQSIPTALREAAEMQGLSGWQTFRYLELPASMIGLVWNSMMSFAGGWFILTVEEAFSYGSDNYELPGLGSYMKEALANWNVPAIVAGVVAMVLMIVAVDQFFWRPIVVWSQRFKLEETATADEPHSWVLQMFKRSMLLKWMETKWHAWRARRLKPSPAVFRAAPALAPVRRQPSARHAAIVKGVGIAVKWVVILGLALLSLWGAGILLRLMAKLPFRDAAETKGWIAVLVALLMSFARVMGALIIGALWAVPVGVWIGLSPRWSNRLQPIIQVVASFPSPMIFPIVTLMLVAMHVHFTFVAVVLMLMGTQWYTLFNVIAGAMAIPSELREAGQVYHMSRWQCWTRLYLPAIFPYLLTGLITAAGGAWNTTIVAEWNQVFHRDGSVTTYIAYGLGYIITDSQAASNYPLLAASAVTMAVFVVAFNRLLWKRLYRAAEGRFSLNT